jgi:hypothetical protein
MTRRSGERGSMLKRGGGSFSPTESAHDIQADAEFRSLLDEHLRRWDETITPDVPAPEQLERLVAEHKLSLRRKLRRELMLLWGIGVFVLSGLLLLWNSGAVLFASVQVGALAAALLFLAGTMRRSGKEEESWTE